LFKVFNDSIYNENTDKEIMKLSMQYEYDQKEKIRKIEEQKKEELQKEKDKRDFLVKLGLSGLVLFMLIIAVISIVNYRRKVKANKLLKAQKEEIEFQKVELEQRNEEILAQRDEIEVKNTLITEQRDLALRQKQEITDSIQYAQRIQEAVLPDKLDFGSDIDDYFILYAPKDIVSGDFYWMTKADDKLIVIAADCTGHGVPGAFMSMLGVTFLNEIVNKDRILTANEILNKLREKVIESLHQKDRETKDGNKNCSMPVHTTRCISSIRIPTGKRGLPKSPPIVCPSAFI
jgi:serine phosphatase RsbU (regulator of sigma subunit)